MNRTPKRIADGQICLFSVSYYPIVSKTLLPVRRDWLFRWSLGRSFYTPRKIFCKTSETGSQNLTHYPSRTPDNLKLYSLFCQNQFLGFNIAHYCHQVLLKSFGLYIYHIEFNFLSSFLNLLLHSNSKTDPLCPTLILIDDSCIAP